MRVAIVGAGQNGGQAYNILKLNRALEVAAFFDDDPKKKDTRKYELPVAGDLASLRSVASERKITGAIAAVGNNALRARIIRHIDREKLQLISAVHPHTFIDVTVLLGDGAIVEMGVMLHPEAKIGRGVFIGGSSVVAHDCVVGDYVLIGGGVIFGGGVTIGPYTTLGVGTILQPQIKVGRNVVTGIGAVVVKDLPDNAVAVGVPARVIRYQDPIEESDRG